MKKKIFTLGIALVLAFSLIACSKDPTATTAPSPTVGEAVATPTPESTASTGKYFAADASAAEVIKAAADAGKVGNWGLGNEYEVQALLTKYSLPTTFLSQAFDMDGFDDDSVLLASAMTYNELGLVQNSYEGGYKYGDTVKWVDMNSEGVAMLEDNLFVKRDFATANPNTVKAFIYASVKGWAYACEHPEEAAEIVFKYGSSVSPEHQAYMASEVAKLVDPASAPVGTLDDAAFARTLDLAKQYIKLDDSVAAAKMQTLVLDDIRDASYFAAAAASADGKFGDLEKTSVKIQLKWLPQAQFMGYYVAKDKGYYEEVGLDVELVSGGGDIGETTAVNNGIVDFGVTWVSNLISANSAGMELIDIAQFYQKSGLVLVYKINE